MKQNRLSSTDQVLEQCLLASEEKTLWLADENALALVESLQAPFPDLITNRFDIHARAAGQSEYTWFTDWDLAPCFESHQYQRVVYRISKEKPVIHHLLNQLSQYLKAGATVLLIGQKNEGIKSIADSAANCFGNKKISKSGSDYLVTINVTDKATAALDCQDYATLRPIAQWQASSIQSKPGTFGWQKIDDGSAFLLDNLAELMANSKDDTRAKTSARVALETPSRVLDLGCGYGFLSIGAKSLSAKQWQNTHWLATDNCAAAITACQANCGSWAEVFAGDRGLGSNGKPLHDKVDLILCNPPFHQGFSPSGDITEKFLKAMQAWLTPKGQALIVVNQFVGIEKRSTGLFKSCQLIADNGSFKVLLLQRY